MDRPTINFETSAGTKFILKSYITGGENWEIRQIYIRGQKAKLEDGSIELEAERKAFTLVIVSINGNSADIVADMMKLPLSEYREVVAEIAPIMDAKKKQETS